jgi:hypothetical protein
MSDLEILKKAYDKIPTHNVKKVRMRINNNQYIAYSQDITKSTENAWLARKGHEVVQVVLNNFNIGVFIDGQFKSYFIGRQSDEESKRTIAIS